MQQGMFGTVDTHLQLESSVTAGPKPSWLLPLCCLHQRLHHTVKLRLAQRLGQRQHGFQPAPADLLLGGSCSRLQAAVHGTGAGGKDGNRQGRSEVSS